MEKNMKFPLQQCFVSFTANFKNEFLMFTKPDYAFIYSKRSLLYNKKDQLSY